MMPGYYQMPVREPVPMAQVYPPVRSQSLAKLNTVPRDYGSSGAIYDKVRVDKSYGGGDRKKHRFFEKLRRQQSYDENMYPRMVFHNQQFPPPPARRHQPGFDSLQLLGAHNDDRYLDIFMENSMRGRPVVRDQDFSKNCKNTLTSTKSSNSKSSNGSNNSNSNNKNNKENKMKNATNGDATALAFLESLVNSSSVDNIYESVEQIHYRKTLETMNRREKVRSVHRTGHPLFDSLREERALASDSPTSYSGPGVTQNNSNNNNKRVSRSAGPSRKTSVASSPTQSSSSSSDEQDGFQYRQMRSHSRTALHQQQQQPSSHQQHQRVQRHSHHQMPSAPSWRRAPSAGSESDDEWVIPRPKIGGRRREVRASSTDESDSSSKSSPMR